jgi:hypothetical protein
MPPHLLHRHRRAAGAHHQHCPFADRFVIQVDADDGIGTLGLCLHLHLFDRKSFGSAKLFKTDIRVWAAVSCAVLRCGYHLLELFELLLRSNDDQYIVLLHF